ncbi:hypothetical protein BDV37DRAFT_235511 [Aspergillus pseudonomiae]|uniref:Uncharacterized protein n=1 Tax=Aspergillus pseudonomiae TaxID=1506151 RepID=A0A5N7DVD0_9EURO|nr:uncharacterized protein BDV37DRAFT_235511 [Aspergillus pseudonomiae]KAE8409999.1 hypothetical protein BDV37DRAFT_235511 [Aspergillus pseudonomiae]
MSGSVQNTISPDITGYIRKERLEARLLSLFGKPIKVRHINERWVFDAPRIVTQSEIE